MKKIEENKASRASQTRVKEELEKKFGLHRHL